MSLQLVFYLDLAKPSTIVATWSEQYGRLVVGRITGLPGDKNENRLIAALREHATKAGYLPLPLGDMSVTQSENEELAWTLLATYDSLDEETKTIVDTSFSVIFLSLSIEQSSMVGIHSVLSEIRLFMEKPDGEYTKAWVWKDTLLWISPITWL